MIGLGYERSHNRTADRTTPARRSEYVFSSAALTLLRIHPKSPRVSRRATTHEGLMRMGLFRMPGCPARGENGAFESIVYYGRDSFHKNGNYVNPIRFDFRPEDGEGNVLVVKDCEEFGRASTTKSWVILNADGKLYLYDIDDCCEQKQIGA